ncbi:MAG: MMPL family transporter [Proteobacteria bacterium]|nr:MMPL family transporter [Pseudomonadota bacterium]
MINLILRYRIVIIIFLISCSIPFAYNIQYLTKDAGVSSLVPGDHPDFLFSSRVEDLFGATDEIVVGVNSKNGIYTKEALQLIHELTLFFEELDEIDEDDVLSITNVDDMEGRDGELIIDPLVEEDSLEELNEQIISKIRKKIRANPLFRGKLVSEDEKSAVVLAGVPTEIGIEEDTIMALKEKTLVKLNELRQRYPGISLDFSGPAMLKAFISEYMQNDLKNLFPLAIVTVALLIFLMLRSFTGMLVPILVTLFAVTWTFGFKAMLGSPITIVETAIPVVLIAIGCADGIHIISEFLSIKRKGKSLPDAVKTTMKLLSLPVLLTSVTTSLGFASLVTAPGVSIRNMGIYLAFGVMVAMLFSLLFIPALISFFKQSGTPEKTPILDQSSTNHHDHGKFEMVVSDLASWLLAHKKSVAGVSLLFLFASIFGILNITVESDEVRYLKPGNVFRAATESIQDNLGGITSLDIVIESGNTDAMKDPKLLKAMEDLQRFCEQDELVSYSLSLVDLIKRINYVLHDNDPRYERLPNETEEIRRLITEHKKGKTINREVTETIPGHLQVAQFLLLYEMSGGETLEQYVDPEYKISRISVRLKDMSSQRLKLLLEKLNSYLTENFPENINVRYANHYIRVVMMDLIIDSQIYSLITILATITILMSIMFRSPIIGLFTALPVFTAVLFNFTLMWLFNVTLNIGTSIIASVGMGVGIDYAIHYFSRFKLFLKIGGAYDESIVNAVSQTSRAILSNASAVGIGFLVLLFSQYGVIANIGWITAVSMFTTAFGSLIILPSLLAIFKPNIPGVSSVQTAPSSQSVTVS